LAGFPGNLHYQSQGKGPEPTDHLSERDVCTKFITPAIERAGWDLQTQMHEEVRLTDGKVLVRGKLVTRGKSKRADYVLYLKPGVPLAVIEAKDAEHSVGAGMQQALEYAAMLGVPFAFSSNGSGFLFHDGTGASRKVESTLKLDELPGPDELWRRYCDWKNLSGEGTDGKRRKYVVSDVPVFVVAERVQYYGKDGKLITESLRDYTKRAIREQFVSLDAFLKIWSSADRKRAVIDELREHGVFFDVLADEVGKDLAAFDLICHVAFGQPPLTRRERANNVRKRNYFTKYGDQVRRVLDALLDKFADEGVDDIEDMGILKVRPLTEHGTPVQIIQQFGGKEPYIKAVRDLEDELYRAS
jgi:type I site-specific restriction endonuclease